MTEDHLGQIWHDGQWLDFARSTDRPAKAWWRQDTANRRVVDWIYKEKIIFPALPPLPRSINFDHGKSCLWHAVSTSMAEDLDVDSMTDFDFRIALQENRFLEAADQKLASGEQDCLCIKPWKALDFWNIVEAADYLDLRDHDAMAKKYLSRDEYKTFVAEIYVGSGQVLADGIIPNGTRDGYLSRDI